MNIFRSPVFFFISVFFSLFVNAQTPPDLLLQSTYPEHYVDIKLSSKEDVNRVSRLFSVDKVNYNHEEQLYDVTVWLSWRDYDSFINLELPFTIQPIAQPMRVNMATTVEQLMQGWDLYPTYDTYENLMLYFQTNHSDICKIDTILAQTPNNHKILVAHISTSLNDPTPKPSFFYTSTMHGDEVCGYYMMLRLIDYILNNRDDAKVRQILDNVDLWISPSENPDGTYNSGNHILGESPVSTRANANGYDLNRNYPSIYLENPTYYEPEITAMMNFMESHPFVMSANLHGGAELFNFVWDAFETYDMKHPDWDWWWLKGREFADTCQTFFSSYFDDMNDGVTEGGDWYVIDGSRQDYANYFARCREVTLEISSQKVMANSALNRYWRYIKNSLINYILESTYGFNGIVTDSATNEPLAAKIRIDDYDDEGQHSEVYSSLPLGDYYRPVLSGTHSVTYSAEGYYPQTHTVSVQNRETTRKDIALVKIGSAVNDLSIGELVIYPNPADDNITISIPSQFINVNTLLYLFDIQGKLIDSYSVTNHKMQICLSSLPAGLYLLKLTHHRKEVLSSKIVKNK